MKFTAACVVCQTQDGVAMLGFSDNEFNTTQYVMLQKEQSPNSEDCKAGFYRVHIEINSQMQSGYGGVLKAQLQQDRLILKLDCHAAAQMGVDDSIEIVFSSPKENLMEISDQLRLLLGSDSVQVDSSKE